MPKGKNKKKVIELIKHRLAEQIMKEFIGLWAEVFIYLKDNNDEDKNYRHKKVCHKQQLIQ